jgi:hypothetical protein
MSVNASFQPARVNVVSGEATALNLHLHNESDGERMVTLRPAGDLAARIVLETETVFLDPNEQLDVPVVVGPDASVAAGDHSCVVEVVDGDVTASADAALVVDSSESWSARLDPQRSRSGGAGRHKIAIENTGNVPVGVQLTVSAEADLDTELAAPFVDVDPGATANVEFRATPSATFWSGPTIEHPFTVALTGSSDESVELDGVYEQGPRIPAWLVPAAAGMFAALLIGTVAWFTLLKPSVESAAREDAAELDTAQQALLDEQVVQIQIAADEASELPLGRATDLRLTVAAGEAVTSTRAFDFDASGSGRTLSITDVIFQNPTGAVGRVELLRDEDVLLDQEMANFRDLDFHLVAPLSVESASSIALRVSCATPGPGTDECEVSATIVGFVDGP